MGDGTARILVCPIEGRIEIEGSEAFVQAQIDAFKEQIAAAIGGSSSLRRSQGAVPPPASTPNPRPAADGLAGYDNLFALADDKVQVLKDLPGTSKAEKMVNGALLLTLANTLLGAETTTFDALRDLCQAHGTLDGPNFSKTLKAEKDAFVFGGTKKKQTLKLTVPGRRRADTLADALRV